MSLRTERKAAYKICRMLVGYGVGRFHLKQLLAMKRYTKRLPARGRKAILNEVFKSIHNIN